jgi:hypothetical protein
MTNQLIVASCGYPSPWRNGRAVAIGHGSGAITLWAATGVDNFRWRLSELVGEPFGRAAFLKALLVDMTLVGAAGRISSDHGAAHTWLREDLEFAAAFKRANQEAIEPNRNLRAGRARTAIRA